MAGSQRVRAFDADLLISIRFGQIFKAEAIAQPRTGIINLHSGLLPEYKGVMASFWSLLNEEPRLGTTLHWITDKKIDSGALISTRSQPVRSSDLPRTSSFSLSPGRRTDLCGGRSTTVTRFIQRGRSTRRRLLQLPDYRGHRSIRSARLASFLRSHSIATLGKLKTTTGSRWRLQLGRFPTRLIDMMFYDAWR